MCRVVLLYGAIFSIGSEEAYLKEIEFLFKTINI